MAKSYHSLGGLGAAAAGAGVLVAVGMLLLTIVVMVEPAGAAFPGQNGKIAFVSNSEIFTVNADGTELDRLTNNTVVDTGPAWSPDTGPIPGDNLIAFSSRRPDGRDADIYTINPLGTKVGPLTLYPTVRLTNHPADDFGPAWSPDGKKIAFRSDRLGKDEIFTMNVYGEVLDLDGLTNETPGQSEPDWQSSRSPEVCPVILCPHRGG